MFSLIMLPIPILGEFFVERYYIKYISEKVDSQSHKIHNTAVTCLFKYRQVSGLVLQVFIISPSDLFWIFRNNRSLSTISQLFIKSRNFCFHVALHWKSTNCISRSSKWSHSKILKLSSIGCIINFEVSTNCL